MDNDYQTPMKSQNGRDGASTIAHGLTDKKDMAESKLEHEEEYTSRIQQDNRLDEIEKQIQQIGEELRNLHYEIEKQPDRYSQNLLSKERYRNQLRKKLIDLDYEHKEIITKRIQQGRKMQEEKRQQIRREIEERQQQIRQEREERQRKRMEELDRYQQEYREKLRGITQSRRNQGSERAEQSASEQNNEKNFQQGNQTSELKPQSIIQGEEDIEDELSRSRRRLRIAEIETQLAESRLRRSRLSTLNAELDHLRYSYSDPYYVYRPYVLPSYYYPYTSYPLYSSRLWY